MIGKLDNVIFCDFCGEDQHKCETIIAGPRVHICGKCVELSMMIVLRQRHGELTPAQQPQTQTKSI